MYEVIILSILALVWIVFASVQDLKFREVADWLCYSLIFFALGFRFFYCLFEIGNFGLFYQGLIGLGIFFILHNLFYYGRIFAGGDAKLMLALGAVLPFSESFLINVKIFMVFLFLFFLIGSLYGFIWSFVLMIKNFKEFKKEFYKRMISSKKLLYLVMFFGLLLMIFGFREISLFYFGILIFIFPYFYLYSKSVDEVCMIRSIKPGNLTEGDWLYEDIKIGRKLIKKNWDGLTKAEIKLLQKRKKNVLIRNGIPFVPVFLISFLLLIYLWFGGFIERFLGYSFW